MTKNSENSSADRAECLRQILNARHSVRGFSPEPVARELITRVLEDARLSPSNSNTQPWHVHIVSGSARDKLSAALLADISQGQFSQDFSYSPHEYGGVYLERVRQQGRAYYEQAGLERDDKEGRMALALKNYEFFGAPHVALLFMPAVGDSVRVAGDIGMFGQTFLLSLVANGLAGVAQTSIGMLAGTVREVLDIPEEFKLLFAISFGFAAEGECEKPGMGKADLEELVTFHE